MAGREQSSGSMAVTAIAAATHPVPERMLLEAEIRSIILRVFEDFDALVCPTLGTYGFTAHDNYSDGIDVNGKQ